MPFAEIHPAVRSSLPIRSMEAIAWAACVWCVYQTVQGLFSDYWWNDFQYFWLAGRMTLEGASPYGPEYLERGMEAASSFSAPFFYPPAILPLLAPLGAIEMNRAAAAFFAINLTLIVGSALLLGRIVAQLVPGVEPRTAAAFAAFALIVCAEPIMISAGIGQTSILFMAASILFAYGAVFRCNSALAIGLCALLIKPHFGMPFLALALACRESRAAAIAGLAANGVLTAVGLLAFGGDHSDIALFMSNVSSYSDHPANQISSAAGLPAISALLGLPYGAAFGVSAATIIAFAIGRVDNTAISPAAVAATAAFALFLVPTHATDYPVAAPALAAVAAARKKASAALIASGLILLARGSQFGDFLMQADDLSGAVAVRTVGLALLGAGAVLDISTLSPPGRSRLVRDDPADEMMPN